MAEYHNIRAPQWIDFTQTASPVQMQDFFEKEHTMHEPMEELCNVIPENAQPATQIEVSVNAKAQADLDIIKSTPIKVISPKYHNSKETVVAEVTYDKVFSDAMRKLELCKKLPKTQDVMNKTTQESKVFKNPGIPKIIKTSRSIGCVLNNQSGQDSARKAVKLNKTLSNNTPVNIKKTLVKQALFKKNEDSVENDTSVNPNNPVDDSKDKETKQSNEEDIKEHEEEEEEDKESENGLVKQTDENEDNKEAENNQDDVDASKKANRTQSNKHVGVLTWQNHRRSMCKRRTSINKPYVGLAEAVSRFQTDTPKRFRTRSTKDNNASSAPLNMSKFMQNRLKPTVPISPALVSKNRMRPVTVLSQEEREMQEIEEMKKHRIKANPIPPNVLRGPRVNTTKVNGAARKSTVTGNASSATQPEEKNKKLIKSKSPHRDTSSNLKNNTVTKVVVSDSDGIIVEHEEIAFFGVPKTGPRKSVTRVMPFSFEARNKDMQMKKEQRLKNLQEASKAKPEFHARPAPKFSKSLTNLTKPPTPPAKQQQTARRAILPCPFSFEERNKSLPKRKEQLVKQMLEEDKRSRLFRANPAPVFKPVMIRGRSKECLSVKNKNAGSEHNAKPKCENQENEEPNEIDSCKTENENMQKPAKSSSACNIKVTCKIPLKALPLELNTDKRAKERREFDEKMKLKEMEDETNRQEREKQQLEHEKQMKAELRKLAETKARPMPMYKPPVIAKANKPLTNPQSPAFASKLKSKQA